MSTETVRGISSIQFDQRSEGETSHSANQSDGLTPSTSRSHPISKRKLWTGRVLTILAVLFLLFDAEGKFVMPPRIVEAFARLGFPVALGAGIGMPLVASTIIYAIPRTAVLGAVLLTGYLGGAVAIQLRAGSPLFETVFPVIFGVIVFLP